MPNNTTMPGRDFSAAAFDDDDEIVDLLEVVKPGRPVKATEDEADFRADLDSMLESLSKAEQALDDREQPFPDPTPVTHRVDHNETLDLPGMDDLNDLLESFGAASGTGAGGAADEDDLLAGIDLPPQSGPDLDAMPVANSPAPGAAPFQDELDAELDAALGGSAAGTAASGGTAASPPDELEALLYSTPGLLPEQDAQAEKNAGPAASGIPDLDAELAAVFGDVSLSGEDGGALEAELAAAFEGTPAPDSRTPPGQTADADELAALLGPFEGPFEEKDAGIPDSFGDKDAAFAGMGLSGDAPGADELAALLGSSGPMEAAASFGAAAGAATAAVPVKSATPAAPVASVTVKAPAAPEKTKPLAPEKTGAAAPAKSVPTISFQISSPAKGSGQAAPAAAPSGRQSGGAEQTGPLPAAATPQATPADPAAWLAAGLEAGPAAAEAAPTPGQGSPRYEEVDLNELDALLDDMLASAPASGPAPGLSDQESARRPAGSAARSADNGAGNGGGEPPAREAIHALAEDVSALRRELAGLGDTRLTSMEKALLEKDARLDALRAELDAQSILVRELTGELRALRGKLDERAPETEDAVAALRGDLAAQNALVRETADALRALSGELDRPAPDNAEEKAAAAAIRNELEALRGDLDARNAATRGELEALRGELETQNAAVRDLTEELHSLRDNMDKLAADAAARVIREELAVLLQSL